MSASRALTRARGLRAQTPAISAPCAPRISSIRFASTAPVSVVDGSFWRSLVPKPLRKENRKLRAKKAKEWNPATFFIVMFLLIGSMSIQMIALRNSFDRYLRQADVRIGLLREVVEKIQRGEQVDVEKALGTGSPKKEADWQEMLEAIERDEAAQKAQKQGKTRRSETQAKLAAATSQTEEKATNAEPEPVPPKTKTGSLANFF